MPLAPFSMRAPARRLPSASGAQPHSLDGRIEQFVPCLREAAKRSNDESLDLTVLKVRRRSMETGWSSSMMREKWRRSSLRADAKSSRHWPCGRACRRARASVAHKRLAAARGEACTSRDGLEVEHLILKSRNVLPVINSGRGCRSAGRGSLVAGGQ